MFTNDLVTQAALVAHEVNRAYCQSIGDDSQLPWDAISPEIAESAIKGMEAILANPRITPEELHASWMAEKLANGWTYGEVKDAEAKTHPCLVSYEELPEEQRAKDKLFRAVGLTLLFGGTGL